MSYFVITGKNDCPNTTHALHVADYLTRNLPHFVYHSVIKTENEWMIYLDQLNSENNWHQTKSPVIWKEISRMGGKKYLIGGLGEFWEYLYDYYGFQSRMSKDDLKKIMADNLLIASLKQECQVHTISIIGCSNSSVLQPHIYELQQCFDEGQETLLEIKLYDQRLDDPDEEDVMLEVIDEIRDTLKCVPQNLHIVLSQEEAISNCDLLIIVQDYSRKSGEDIDLWLDRCRKSMVLLADDVNHFAKRSLRIVLNHHGPVCFNASVLMEYCTTIRLTNIVAVTTDEAISIISQMAEKVNEYVENFWCPPVWGFCGLMSYIPIQATCIKTNVYRPFKRALKAKATSKLPKGVIQPEIRFLEHLIKTEDDLYEEIENRKEKEKKLLGREPILPKVRALGSLLKRWYAKEINDDIISLGIYSKGTFGFPRGICVSQPVLLNENRVWTPIPNLPLRETTKAKIQAISLHIDNTLKKYGLGQRFTHTD
ncbi:putative malate dehydrogenase 1B [Tribolium castaneum]|uniref:Malate dehydrogenase 1B-like Protein n=1 Tax=Tribolium castaneum TaxID=7070 RepID=D2A536_TRICA|nr:PREDICTED: putative malate dehydrogenase 1B [Tribolium castaneum]EFA05309.2 Putative malate dehydrogenase 1B-like Protein [Tribolium castaneum]|eukprot:XP_008194611.1 PREDICTED: putative malate dehydrogenase 1B [Tribolium castaneum]